jgi:hypothetical protein
MLLFAALSAPALAAAQQPAPLKMGLITAGIEAGAAGALDRVIAASPLIERLPATPPPVEDTDAARAAWLRANKLEGAILAAQAGDVVTLTAVGPRGELLGREVMAAGAADVEAQRALQRAAGLIGPPVLLYRAQPVVEPPVEPPVELPAEPPAEPQLVRPAPKRDTALAAARTMFGASYGRMAVSSAPDGTEVLNRRGHGASLWFEMLPPPRGAEAGGYWLDTALHYSVSSQYTELYMNVLAGRTFAPLRSLHFELGTGLHLGSVRVSGAESWLFANVGLLGFGLRWMPHERVLFRFYNSADLAIGLQPDGLGPGASSTYQLRGRIYEQLYLELFADQYHHFHSGGDGFDAALDGVRLGVGLGWGR